MKDNKKVFFTELAYVFGLLFLALGTAMMEAADFGVSMVVAPAYLLHRKLSTVWSFFTFGVAEYVLQLTLLVLMIVILRRFRLAYLFSFCTAVLYGVILDGAMAVVAYIPSSAWGMRMMLYLVGLILCALGVSLLFHTYFSPEVYELLVKEIAAKWHFSLAKTKTVYDCISCAVAIVLSFLFFGFGQFEGVRLGTVFCALVNGWTIGACTRILERIWTFRDALPLRRYFVS